MPGTMFPFDELNRLKTKFSASLLSKNDKEWIYDDLISLFLMSYTLGCEQTMADVRGAVAYFGDADKAIFKEIDGETWEERLEKALEGGNPLSDVIRIAETEAHRDYNTGAYDTALRSNATTKTWKTMLDDRVRDTHDYIEGVSAPIDGVFTTYDGDSAKFPGDFSRPENNINCRCFLTYT